MTAAARKWNPGGRRARFVLAILLAVVLVPSLVRADGSDDDWHVVERHSVTPPAGVVNGSPSSPAAAKSPSAGTIVACGERAIPAVAPYTTIMANLNSLWGTNARIYQSIAMSGPHARSGGCIFYNRRFLSFLTKKWMGIENPEEVQPMLYAIFAHELGHVVHGDLSPDRANVPIEERELEADRFAGYTLWRLNIRFDAEDLAHYYRVVGDDFVGVSHSHGSGHQRAAALEDGYDRARLGLPEEGAAPATGLDGQ